MNEKVVLVKADAAMVPEALVVPKFRVVTGETHADHWCDLEEFEGKIQLNRAWIYGDQNEDEEPIGETNFVIPIPYLEEVFEELFPNEKSLDHFLAWYIPEEDGEKIYQRAKADGQVVEEYLYFENPEDIPSELKERGDETDAV